MSVVGWAEWLIVAGGVLQAGGVSVLVLEIRASRRRRDEYRHRPQTLEIESAVHTHVVSPVGLISGTEPTVAERVERAEGQIRELREELDEKIRRVEQTAREAASVAAGSATRHGDRRFDALEHALFGDSTLERWLRLGSIAAVVLGVILATIGSVAAW